MTGYKKIGTNWNNEMRNEVDRMFKELFNHYLGAGMTASEAKQKAEESMNIANQTRKELNDIVREQTEGGDIVPEVVQARGGETTLGERLNKVDDKLTKSLKQSFADKNRAELFTKLVELNEVSGIVTMIGDSLTGGVSSGGHPYFEPWQDLFPNVNFINKGIGGNTSKDILDRVDDIAATNAELYVIACGTNDVRYQNANSALSGSEYVSVINDIITALSPADFVLINPWPAFDKDTNSKLPYLERDELTDEFSDALSKYASDNGYPFIETNRELRSVIDWGNKDIVLVDSIHPRYPAGIKLYSDVVLYGNVNGASYGLTKTKSVGKHLYRIEIIETSKLETQFNNISIMQLYSDVPILEIWTDNYRINTSDPNGLISGYNESYRFSNHPDQYPVNITFSTDKPITELYQLEERLYRLIGKYNLYYSFNREAIVDVNHESWKLKYSSMDANNGLGTLLYQEPYLNMEERYFYMLKITPKGQAIRLNKVNCDKNILRHDGRGFSSVYPVTSNLLVEHAIETRTGSSSAAYYFYSTNSKINNLTLGFAGSTGNLDLVVSFGDRFNTLTTDETHNDWQEILSTNDISTISEVSFDIPNH